MSGLPEMSVKPRWIGRADRDERSSIVAKGLFACWNAARQRDAVVLAITAGCVAASPHAVTAQSRGQAVTVSATLATTAHHAMTDIFRKKDPTAVDRYFCAPFIQHDPSLADGLAGMKSFAAEIANAPAVDITIHRTLVDGDFVLLHSKYQGVAR